MCRCVLRAYGVSCERAYDAGERAYDARGAYGAI